MDLLTTPALQILTLPADAIMEQGGDERLRVDPATGLNGYGTSHRPRPWAITFASCTASSTSERGYAGAESARLRMLEDSMAGDPDGAAVREAARIRAGIAGLYGVPSGTEVFLCPSGTDGVLLALAIAQAAPGQRPVTTVLSAPEETGSGVPLASAGCHFAAGTARGAATRKGAPVPGFRADTRTLAVPVRDAEGLPRPTACVDSDFQARVGAVTAAGRRALLQVLDGSKTGLIAPSPAAAAAMAAIDGVDVLVDACQARTDESRVRRYLARGWMVLITGSKFFTGPPFTGALLVPHALMERLAACPLPAGLAAYYGAGECPEAARAGLPSAGNPGMLLRWAAALEEMRAFFAISPADRHDRLEAFITGARGAIEATPGLHLVPTPAPDRGDHAWDSLPTILAFTLRGPHGALDLEDARRVYRWLNADLSPWLDGALAARLCHVGQPVALPTGGALRLVAGARIVSGEPSHAGLDTAERLAREIADARTVVAKTALILRNFDVLRAADPQPRFR